MPGNIYHATTAAAKFLRQHPERYNYYLGFVPETEHTRACAIGWVGFFANLDWDDTVQAMCVRSRAPGDMEIYRRFDKFEAGWEINPHACARALKKYAKEWLK